MSLNTKIPSLNATSLKSFSEEKPQVVKKEFGNFYSTKLKKNEEKQNRFTVLITERNNGPCSPESLCGSVVARALEQGIHRSEVWDPEFCLCSTLMTRWKTSFLNIDTSTKAQPWALSPSFVLLTIGDCTAKMYFCLLKSWSARSIKPISLPRRHRHLQKLSIESH